MTDQPMPTSHLRWKRRPYTEDEFDLQQWCITPEGFRWVDVPHVGPDAPDDKLFEDE